MGRLSRRCGSVRYVMSSGRLRCHCSCGPACWMRWRRWDFDRTANVLLTDSPSYGYDHVYVTVDHVEISSDGGSWTSVPVSASLGRIDLLSLNNGTLISLGQAP